MPTPNQYRRIAERYGVAADLVNPDIPEACGFAAYHTFESIGCAWIRHQGRQVPRGHRAKINKFVTLVRRESFRRGVAYVAILTNALRNRMLYPSDDGTGNYVLPEDVLSARDAEDLLRRVRGVARRVAALL
jgi:hypothetical protein